MLHHMSTNLPFAKQYRIFLSIICHSLLIMGLLTPSPGWADRWQGKVVRVMDGDSLVVMRDRKPIRIRLAGIDTPERGQPFAKEAQQFTRQRVAGKRVQIDEKEADRYDRIVAWVTRPGEEELGAALVRAGLAWRHIYYSKDPNLIALEQEARARGLGLWSQAAPTPPWVWKQRHKKEW